MSELYMAKEYWWESDGEYYRPNTLNLKNFKPPTGLLHHFYAVYVHDLEKFNEVRMRPYGVDRIYRVDPMTLDSMAHDLSPFKGRSEEVALLVMSSSGQKDDRGIHGTYSLVKKVNGQKLFVRPERHVEMVGSSRRSRRLGNR